MTEPNTTLGRYVIQAELGKGGFATVFRALDTSLNREVALKILHPQLLADRTFVDRFRKEARTLASLRHAHIVTIYEVSEAEGRVFIAMELAHGSSLAQAIADRKHLPWTETLAILKPVTEALDYAHGQGVVHRDLKPANILLDSERGPLLTDFGFARLMGDSSVSMSLSGGILGTPAYIAPEVWELDMATAAADIYALGCIAYEMVTGQVLFSGKTPMQTMRAHDRGPQFNLTLPGDVPQSVAQTLQVALARQPEARYPSASALWHALNDLEANAQAAREQAERQAIANQWKAEVETALADHEWSAAKMAVGRWLAITPEDAQAIAARDEITRQIEQEARIKRQEAAAAIAAEAARKVEEEQQRLAAEEKQKQEAATQAAAEAKAKQAAEEQERQRQATLATQEKAKREAEAAAIAAQLRREAEEKVKREAIDLEQQLQAVERQVQGTAFEPSKLTSGGEPASAPTKTTRKWSLAMVVIAVLGIIGVFIASNSSSGTNVTPFPTDPLEAVRLIADKQAGVKTHHLDLTLDLGLKINGFSSTDASAQQALELFKNFKANLRLTGDVDSAKNASALKGSADLGPLTAFLSQGSDRIEFEFININSTSFTKGPDGVWNDGGVSITTDVSTTSLQISSKQMSDLLKKATQAEYLGDQKIADVETYRYRVTFDPTMLLAEIIASLIQPGNTGSSPIDEAQLNQAQKLLANSTVIAEILVGKQDLFIRQIKFDFTAHITDIPDQPNAQADINLASISKVTNINEPVVIVAPK